MRLTHRRLLKTFNDSVDYNYVLCIATIAWEEPEIMKSCWTQAMLASRLTFVPSCNMNDTFSPKQCHKQR